MIITDYYDVGDDDDDDDDDDYYYELRTIHYDC